MDENIEGLRVLTQAESYHILNSQHPPHPSEFFRLQQHKNEVAEHQYGNDEKCSHSQDFKFFQKNQPFGKKARSTGVRRRVKAKSWS